MVIGKLRIKITATAAYNPSMRTSLSVLVAAVLALTCHGQQAPAKNHSKEVIHGHVVADVASLVFGAGLGHKWVSFIFAAEQTNGPKLIRIAYAFDVDSQLPPDSFWNYRNRYEMRVRRDPRCDTTVQDISYERNLDPKGGELPPSFILHFTKNSPVNALRPDLMLPCYVLWHSDYKLVEAESSGQVGKSRSH